MPRTRVFPIRRVKWSGENASTVYTQQAGLASAILEGPGNVSPLESDRGTLKHQLDLMQNSETFEHPISIASWQDCDPIGYQRLVVTQHNKCNKVASANIRRTLVLTALICHRLGRVLLGYEPSTGNCGVFLPFLPGLSYSINHAERLSGHT